MRRSRSRSLWLTWSLCLVPALLLLHAAIPTSAAPDGLRAAWENARRAGAYRFAADILQTTIPLPTLTNVGRQSEQDRLYVEGQTNLSEESLDLTVWSQGGSLLRAENGLQVRVADGRATARQGAGTWEEMDDFTGLFAPQGDALAYLESARDVVDEGTEARAGISFTRYTFQVDGPRFAAYVRAQLERQMAERGELPPGAAVELPRLYAEMTGQGELWVGVDGLPPRQILHLQFPEVDDERVEAEVDATFSDFGAGAAQALPQSLMARIASQETLLQGGTLGAALALLALTLVFRRSKKAYAALILAVTISMVVTPLLQSGQAAALGQRQAARAREQEQRSQEAQWARDLELSLSAAAAPSLPASPGALALIRGDDVTDGDGLTDYEEVLLGTDSIYADTDGDLITDTLELMAHKYTDEAGVVTEFYGDPLQPDGNRDGIVDSLEWNPGAERPGGKPADTDGDGVPDIADPDNDGDGMPDKLDRSPFQTSGTERVFDGANHFSLIVDNLEPGMPTYVEFQVRPTDHEHLWYAYNVLDWPDDDKQGQIQDGDGATYADLPAATGDLAAAQTNRNGDIKLLPMLEIVIPAGGADNLPLTSTPKNLYGVYVQDMAKLDMGEGKILYVPLQLVVDPDGGARVAFTGKMLYLPGESWDVAHQVRLVWAVQALLDMCLEMDTKPGGCKTYDLAKANQPQVIQRYDDEWVLTGLNVREDHGQEVGIVWEDPAKGAAPGDDDAQLLLLSASPQTATGGSSLLYAAHVANAGPDPAAGTALTLTLPAQVPLPPAPAGCDVDGRSLVCSLGDLEAGQTTSVRLRVDVPFAVAGPLVCRAAAGSTTDDPDPRDDHCSLETSVQPYPSGAALLCDGPNLLANGGFEQGFQGNGVARYLRPSRPGW